MWQIADVFFLVLFSCELIATKLPKHVPIKTLKLIYIKNQKSNVILILSSGIMYYPLGIDIYILD